MRIGLLGSAVLSALLLFVPGAQQLALGQLREPTIDERFRDTVSNNNNEEQAPHLNAPQSKLAPPKLAESKETSGAYLGVTFAANEQRAVVSRVAPGSPAEQAGLQPNDLIETLQGRQVRTNQDVLDIVAMLRPGDVLQIGFSRRMNIRTQAPLASMPTATTRSVGYPPDLPASTMAAPEDPVQRLAPTPPAASNNPQAASQSNRNSAQQNRNDSSTQRRDGSQNNNRSQENRGLLGRGLRLR